MPFGISSPITTWRNVRIRYAKTHASTDASTVLNTRWSTGSPRAPMARLVAVTPSCIAAMNRGGSAVIVSTSRALRLPSFANSCSRVRLAVTSPYSAATKYAVQEDQRRDGEEEKRDSHAPSGGAAVEASRRPPAPSKYRRPGLPTLAQTNTCSLAFRHGTRRVPRGAVQGRAQPREGHAVPVVAQPVHGLRASLHVLLRARVRAARRPAVRRRVRALDPRQGERRRGAARASSRGGRGSARAIAIGAATDPYQPAEGRYRLTRACLEALRRRVEPVPHHHARTDDRPRRRRARRGVGAGEGRCQLLDPDARRGRLAQDRARDRRRPASGSALCASSSTRASTRASPSRRSCPASPTGPSSSRGRDRGRARRRREHLWAASCT